jgi:hypothetical protein
MLPLDGSPLSWSFRAALRLHFGCLFWRRMTVAGAWATTLVSFAVLLFTGKIAFFGFVLWDFYASFAEVLPKFMVFQNELYLPWQMVFYLGAGLISGIIVSLLTRPVSEKKLENFYALTRTPITPGEQVDAPCTLPQGAEVPQRRNIFANTNLEIAVPSRMSVFGFLVGWACVVAIYLFVRSLVGG